MNPIPLTLTGLAAGLLCALSACAPLPEPDNWNPERGRDNRVFREPTPPRPEPPKPPVESVVVPRQPPHQPPPEAMPMGSVRYLTGRKTEDPSVVISPYPPYDRVNISRNPATGKPYARGDLARDTTNRAPFKIP